MPIATGTAILGAGALAAGGAIAGGAMQSGAIKDASDTATQEQRRQFDIAQANQKPWLVTGTSALNKLGAMYGLDTYQPNYSATGSPNVVPQPVGGNVTMPRVAAAVAGGAPAVAATSAPQVSATGTPTAPIPGTYTPGSSQPGVDPYADFYKSPDYQFRLTEGIKGLDASAAAGGALDSGATRKGAIEYAGNLASGEFNTYANRLQALAGVGQTTASNLAGQGADYARNVGNIAMERGAALSSSYGNTIGQLAGIGSGVIQNLPQNPSTGFVNSGPGWYGAPGSGLPGVYVTPQVPLR